MIKCLCEGNPRNLLETKLGLKFTLGTDDHEVMQNENYRGILIKYEQLYYK